MIRIGHACIWAVAALAAAPVSALTLADVAARCADVLIERDLAAFDGWPKFGPSRYLTPDGSFLVGLGAISHQTVGELPYCTATPTDLENTSFLEGARDAVGVWLDAEEAAGRLEPGPAIYAGTSPKRLDALEQNEDRGFRYAVICDREGQTLEIASEGGLLTVQWLPVPPLSCAAAEE